MKFLGILNNMRESNYWQRFHFGVNYPFKSAVAKVVFIMLQYVSRLLFSQLTFWKCFRSMTLKLGSLCESLVLDKETRKFIVSLLQSVINAHYYFWLIWLIYFTLKQLSFEWQIHKYCVQTGSSVSPLQKKTFWSFHSWAISFSFIYSSDADSQFSGFCIRLCSMAKSKYSCMFGSPQGVIDRLASGRASSSACSTWNPQSLEPNLCGK